MIEEGIICIDFKLFQFFLLLNKIAVQVEVEIDVALVAKGSQPVLVIPCIFSSHSSAQFSSLQATNSINIVVVCTRTGSRKTELVSARRNSRSYN
jgi:hypothetical protein